MFKFLKKVIPLISLIQFSLYSVILLIGLFAYRTWYSSYFPGPATLLFYEDPLNLITIGVQFIFFISIAQPIWRIYKDSLIRIRLYGFLSSFFHFALIVLYIIGPFGAYGDYDDIPNIAAYILGFFWIISLVFFIISFFASLLFGINAPRYKNEKQILQLKSKKSKDASNNIRELKRLLDEGIISKEVFDEKSKKYIEEL